MPDPDPDAGHVVRVLAVRGVVTRAGVDLSDDSARGRGTSGGTGARPATRST